MSELKNCPNPNCKEIIDIHVHGLVNHIQVQCGQCETSGPCENHKAAAIRTWNALPRESSAYNHGPKDIHIDQLNVANATLMAKVKEQGTEIESIKSERDALLHRDAIDEINKDERIEQLEDELKELANENSKMVAREDRIAEKNADNQSAWINKTTDLYNALKKLVADLRDYQKAGEFTDYYKLDWCDDVLRKKPENDPRMKLKPVAPEGCELLYDEVAQKGDRYLTCDAVEGRVWCNVVPGQIYLVLARPVAEEVEWELNSVNTNPGESFVILESEETEHRFTVKELLRLAADRAEEV